MFKKKKFFIIASIITVTPFWVWCYYTSHQWYHYRLPTKYSLNGIPLVEIKLHDQKHLLELDLGSKLQLVLTKSVLDSLDKIPNGSLITRDMSGRPYETPAYTISSINVGGLVIDEVVAKEESNDYVLNTTFTENCQKNIEKGIHSDGSIGSAPFSDKNLLLDFDYLLFFISNNIPELKKLGYNLEEFIKVPYISSRHLIILKVNTDLGESKFALDTGCSASFIRSSFISHITPQGKKFGLPFITTSKFEIGGKDFGPLNLCTYDITPKLSELDGLLGMDFLFNHVVYIDRENKQVYIQSVDRLLN